MQQAGPASGRASESTKGEMADQALRQLLHGFSLQPFVVWQFKWAGAALDVVVVLIVVMVVPPGVGEHGGWEGCGTVNASVQCCGHAASRMLPRTTACLQCCHRQQHVPGVLPRTTASLE